DVVFRSIAGTFFFAAEEAIRDLYVTGVLACALPIDRPADHGDTAVFLPTNQVAVTPGHDQPEDRRVEVRLLEQPGEDVGGEVTDADHRQLARPGERLPQVDADQKAADQAWPPGHGDAIDLLPA